MTETTDFEVARRTAGIDHETWTLRDRATGRTATGYTREEAVSILAAPLGPTQCPMCSCQIVGFDITAGVRVSGPLGSWVGVGQPPSEMYFGGPFERTTEHFPALDRYVAYPCEHEFREDHAKPIIEALRTGDTR